MTRLISLGCAVLALALSAWSLRASTTANTTLAFAAATHRDTLRPGAAAGMADRLEGAAERDALARPDAADAPRAGAPLPLLPRPGLSRPDLAARRSDSAVDGDEAGVSTALPLPLPAPTAPAPRSLPPADATTLGYTLPASRTASENALAPR